MARRLVAALAAAAFAVTGVMAVTYYDTAPRAHASVAQTIPYAPTGR